METVDEIRKPILAAFYSQIMVVLSWGAHDFKPTEKDAMKGIHFLVQGFLHKGAVEVLYNEGKDLFEIRLLSTQTGEVIKRRENIYLSELVFTIDRLVEYCDNYEQTVRTTYGLSPQQQ